MSGEIPENSRLWDISAHYNDKTIPRELRVASPLPNGLWAKVIVERGELNLTLNGSDRVVAPGKPAVIPPDTEFKIAPTRGTLRFYMQYFHPPIVESAEELAALGH